MVLQFTVWNFVFVTVIQKQYFYNTAVKKMLHFETMKVMAAL